MGEWNGPNGQSCGNCFFYVNEKCLRYAPVPIPYAGVSRLDFDPVTEWPDVEEHLWCGEWKGRVK